MNAVPQAARPLLLLVDDDATFRQVLGRALERRGFDVMQAGGVDEAMAMAGRQPPAHAVVDLRMPGPSGLELVARLRASAPAVRIVVLTGYASIATAVEAIKLGATHYLTKPADAEDIVEALGRGDGNALAPIAARPLSVERLEWEHLQSVLRQCDGNVSAAARHLGMHRRTLQRKLGKRPARH